MLKDSLITELKQTCTFFKNTLNCLAEEDSSYTPAEGMYTVAGHVAHTAMTVDWFIEGAFDANGFDMDFETHIQKAMKAESLTDALAHLDRSFENAIAVIQSKSDEELQSPLPDGPIMGGAPRLAIVGGIVDHTAHHRGSVSVYARLRGKSPAMPYG